MVDKPYEKMLMNTLTERPRVAGIASQERVIESFYETTAKTMLVYTFILSLFAGVIAFRSGLQQCPNFIIGTGSRIGKLASSRVHAGRDRLYSDRGIGIFDSALNSARFCIGSNSRRGYCQVIANGYVSTAVCSWRRHTLSGGGYCAWGICCFRPDHIP
jgi:hypothetical protein